jgi:hypothetical protein
MPPSGSPLVANLPILKFSGDVKALIQEYARRLAPAGASIADLPHFAFAVAYKMDFLVTWNCTHIANGRIIRRRVDGTVFVLLRRGWRDLRRADTLGARQCRQKRL